MNFIQITDVKGIPAIVNSACITVAYIDDWNGKDMTKVCLNNTLNECIWAKETPEQILTKIIQSRY
jgi:hypothetical protein